MIDVVVDQCLFGLANGLFHGVKLLSNVETRSSFLDHRNDAAKMPFGTFQPFHDIRMGLMSMID